MSWAVIAGVSAGTGAAVARSVARDPGLDVFGVHRGYHPEGAAAVKADVEAEGRAAHLRVGEAGTWEGVDAAAEELLAVAGPGSVKLFVHSVACASVARLVTGPGFQPAHPKQFTKTFDAMAHSFVWWGQALYDRNLLAPNARLVALSNPMEDQVLRGTALIAAAKAALGSYVRHMAHELGPKGHRVNVVRFGAVETTALSTTLGDQHAARHRAVVAAGLPARRLVRLEEVADFVAALATDRLAWFNGANIDLTGGETQSLLDLLVHGSEE
jgi:3-oxoacyl-[acyl-carrier protein] reductase